MWQFDQLLSDCELQVVKWIHITHEQSRLHTIMWKVNYSGGPQPWCFMPDAPALALKAAISSPPGFLTVCTTVAELPVAMYLETQEAHVKGMSEARQVSFAAHHWDVPVVYERHIEMLPQRQQKWPDQVGSHQRALRYKVAVACFLDISSCIEHGSNVPMRAGAANMQLYALEALDVVQVYLVLQDTTTVLE